MRGRVRSPDPPAGWVKPEFDDSSWPRGFQPEFGTSFYDPVIRVERLRGRFEVSDPARVTVLRLQIEYIGGVAVHLNGQEVARKNLPSGKLTADVLADGYPKEAYEWGLPRKADGYIMSAREWAAPSDPKAARWRRLSVALDSNLLRRGTNVLAVALHQSGYNAFAQQWVYNTMGSARITGRAAETAIQVGKGAYGGDPVKGVRVYMCPWAHLMVKEMKLLVSPPAAARRPASPPGRRIWLADIHRRLTSRDSCEPGGPPPILRLVGAKNGAYSAQVAVSDSRPVTGLAARAGELTHVRGAGKIPAEAISVRYGLGRPIDEMALHLSEGRGWTESPAMTWILNAHAPGLRTRDERRAASKVLKYFDHLSARAPDTAVEGVQPFWVTVRVPKDAPAGEYRGTLVVQPGDPKSIQIRLMVMDWALPDAKEFSSFVGVQHSIWRVCEQYKAAPWSGEHWQLVERSMKWLAELGNDVAVLPLVCGVESGAQESLVFWTKKGGQYAYDWTNLDRYLDLVAKHWGRNCVLIGEVCWVPFRGGKEGWPVLHRGITVAGGGQRKELALPAPGCDEWSKLFPPFAKAVREHVKAKGFRDLRWGWFFDGVPDGLRAMAEALAKAAPGVGWARASHNGNTRRPFPKGSKAQVTLDMHIRGFPQPFDRKTGDPVSRRGWNNPGNVLFPRVASEIQALGRFDSPMAHRWLAENCLVNGAAGFGRLGADFWPPFDFKNWYSPFVTHLLYPGPDGAEGSARFEALREGVQEAEVRIFLERAGRDQAPSIKAVLDERIHRLGVLPAGADYTQLGNYYAGWQARSWDLYAAAAAASGGKAPRAEEKAAFFASR